MLTFMRKHARSWFIKVLLGTVIVVFIFFYGFNLRERAATLIASVNGTKIGQRTFQQQYQRLLKAQQGQLPQMSAEQIRAIKQAALNQMINDILLLREAERLKLSISEGELREYIQNIPAFQEDGKFSLSRYHHALRFQGHTEETFTEELQRALLIQKTEDFIRDSAKLTDNEVETLYRLFHDRIVLDYVVFGPDSYLEETTLTPEEVQDYLSKHVADYQIPEKVEAEFLKIEPGTYLPEVQVTEQELQERYDSNLDRWKQSKQVLARHILLRIDEDEDPTARMEILQRAEKLLARLQEGEDFERLAKEYSEDPETASEGGLLGWVEEGELHESLDEALFEEMSSGLLSDRPIKSPEGFHILKLDEVKSESISPLAEVKDTLENEIKQDKAHQTASELANQAYMAIFQGASFEETAKQFKIPLEKTPPFPMHGSVEGLHAGTSFREAAFSLEDEDDFSEVIEERKAFFILRVVEKHPSREPELDEVQEQVEEDLRQIKASERAKQEADEFVQTLIEGEKAFSELAEENGHDVQTSPPLGRFMYQPSLPGELIERAFSVPQEKELIQEVIPFAHQYYVAKINERISADPADLENQQATFRSELFRQRREAAFLEWLDMVRARSEIKTYKAYDEML